MRLSESAETGHEWMVFVTCAVVNYVLPLKGGEGVLFDLGGWGALKLEKEQLGFTLLWLCWVR